MGKKFFLSYLQRKIHFMDEKFLYPFTFVQIVHLVFQDCFKKIEDVYDNNEQFDHHQKSYGKNRQYRIKRFGRKVNLIKRFKREETYLM